MDPFDRIQQLEDELRTLRQQAEQEPAVLASDSEELSVPVAGHLSTRRSQLAHHAGLMWSEQLAVVVVMSVLVMLLTYALTRSEGASPWGRAWAISGAGALALGLGLAARKRQRAFGGVVTGAGLAILYGAGFGIAFLPGMGLGAPPGWAPAVLLILIAALAAVAGLVRSQLAAGVLMTAVYGSLVLCCTLLRNTDSLQYALAAIPLPATLVALFHIYRRWRPLNTWVHVCAQACLFTFFAGQPSAWSIPDTQYARLLMLVVTMVYVSGVATSMLDGRRTGGFARSVSALLVLETGVYTFWVFVVILPVAGAPTWVMQWWVALCVAAVGLLSEGLVCRRTFLARAHLTLSVAILVFALAALLSAARLWAALSLTGLTLAAAYAITHVEILLLLNTAVLLVTFGGAVSASGHSGAVTLWGWTFPASSFIAVSVSLVWMVTAWTFTHTVREPLAERRRLDRSVLSKVRLRKHTVALMHAGFAAILLALVTSLEAGEDPRLPFVLAILALTVWVTGWLTLAPVIRIASMFLLASAHTAFHFLMWVNRPVFEGQPRFVVLTLALACATLVLGWGWERALLSGRHRHGFMDHLLAWAPAIGAVLLALRLTGALTPIAIVLLLQTSGILLILVGCITRGMSFAAAGMFSMIAGTRLYLQCIDTPEGLTGDSTVFLVVFAAMLASFVLAERMLYLLELRDRSLTRLDDLARTVLVAGAGMVGLLALNRWAPDERLALYWAFLGLSGLVASLLLRESRYRWAGVLVLMTAALAMLLTPSLLYRLAGVLLLGALVGGAFWLHHRMSHPPHIRESGDETPLCG